jgi:hypothetical protein
VSGEPGLKHLNLVPETVGFAQGCERPDGGLDARARERSMPRAPTGVPINRQLLTTASTSISTSQRGSRNLDDDEARGWPDRAEGLAVHLRDNVPVGRIHEEHTRSDYVTKRRAGLAKGFVDDLQAPSSLHTDVRVYMAVRPRSQQSRKRRREPRGGQPG